jgi:membrane-associated protease RseP (regulator of RpoE activity)
MIRFKIVRCFALLGSLIASPLATGQEPPKADPPSPERVAKTEAASERLILERNDLILDQDVSGVLGLSNGPDDPNSPVARLTAPSQRQDVQYQVRKLAKTFDALETNFGLSLSDADDALRAQLEIPPGQGVVVVGVRSGSLAEHSGLKTNDVILSLGDQKAGDVAQVRKILLGLGKEALEVKLIREGKPSRMSLVGPEHGFPAEAAEYWIGVPVSPVDATLRAHLPSLVDDTGLIVNDVVKGSPADGVSVRKNDILVAMDGKPLNSPDALIEQIQASKGKPVPLEILRAGKPITLTITPAKRVHPTVINLAGRPGGQTQYQFVRPNFVIEVDPRSPVYPVTPHFNPDGKIEVRDLLHQGRILRVDPTTLRVEVPGPPTDVQLEMMVNRVDAVNLNARIEAQLKEVMAKLNEISKAVEGLKKSAGQ